MNNILRAAGYRILNIDNPSQEIGTPAWETLGVPEEKSSALLPAIIGS